MRKLFILTALLFMTGTADAQNISWGITGRVGAFTTLERSEQDVENDDASKGLGLQSGIGFWLSKPITTNGRIQITLLQTVERQHSGSIAFVNENSTPVADLKVVDLNFALNGSIVYLHQVNDTWSVGTGVGALYEYFSQAKVSLESTSNMQAEYNEKFENHFRRDFRFYLPLEAQYKLTGRISLLGQVQAQVSNRITAKETNFKENDLGMWIGINYTF